MEGEGSYKCGTCMAIFSDFDALKEHYKTDWHRFNLKRKVVQLPPISEKDFNEKVAPTQQSNESNNPWRCDICNKTFSSEKALQQHLKSKVHLKMVEKKRRAEEKRAVSASESEKTDKETETLTESEGVETTPTLEEGEVAAGTNKAVKLTHKHCLFSNKRSKTRAANMAYMAKEYGLFIPDAEYLADLSGLLDYLIEKISVHHVCLYCGKRFSSQNAVQDHMKSVNHCKLRYETDEEMAEYADFYDFSTSYEQYQNRMKLADIEDDDDEGENEEKEGEEKEETEEEKKKREEEKKRKEDERAVVLLEESHKGNVTVTNAGYELIFSNGKAVGHRDFQQYYKQKPRPVDTRESVQIAKMMAEYKMLGYAPPRNERNFIDKKTQRIQAKNHMQVGVKGNKLFKVRLQVREC
mmetsp:Transcript_37577/g.59286  ORF Transcript_37577/g.59286 Transcript_37577/m.59286 type:complete len:410 (+) Transcript_37577:1253-2482(+)|eukprot:CAMPEP_0201516826 /NCGR_PEP_ID=MMETSP0161_2-20130828/8052_1 /ASSEMBLY_ACC=CAM_ASM_000251 /TAXON_ID=180227 /ORGANISM="Neoparamoeba aestuarina, Strain SoJaBio B1-5/56/2" /LENGTH=409 /DNA_ID=CAMNT_0047914111 /DNA_START=72 /DNA_END=1301 /DNA_ORIENTATION=+